MVVVYRQQTLGTPVSFRGCRVYASGWLLAECRVGGGGRDAQTLGAEGQDWLNVALVADAEAVTPWELRLTLVIFRVGGTPFGRLNE
jgi:hypothetical protein